MFSTVQENSIQSKHSIGQPNDQYEQEADAMADQVMRMPKSQLPPIQRKCEDCEEEELQMKPLTNSITPLVQKQVEEEEEEVLQMKGTGNGEVAISNLQSSLQQSRGGGQHLTSPVNSFMSRSIGADFSNVKIHTDSNSAQMNRQLNARAFTNGLDIYFNEGQFDPKSSEGKHLLAHELTHVVQQNRKSLSSAGNVIQKASPVPPYEGYVSTRWFASLRSTAGKTKTNFVRALPRNTRVTVTADKGGWLSVHTTIDGEVVTGFVWHRLISQMAASGFTPAANSDSRQEVTAFGTYNVYPNTPSRTMEGNELYESEFTKLQTAWTRVNDNSAGMVINGTPGDVSDMIDLFGREMSRSLTFRNLIVEITEDTANPITVNAGRDNASWLDSFPTNNVDLKDTENLDENPRADYEWATTQGEILTHWLTERRHAIRNPAAGFDPAHDVPTEAGGTQQQFRSDIGTSGRTVSQTRVDETNAAGVNVGLHRGIYTDDLGNQMLIRRDDSGGDPVPYEIEYVPVAPTAAAPGETRSNRVVANVTSSSATSQDIYLIYTAAGGATITSPTQSLVSGSAIHDSNTLKSLVPTGASIEIEIYRSIFLWPDSLLGTFVWSHPFNVGNLTVMVDGVTYTLNVNLQMDP